MASQFDRNPQFPPNIASIQQMPPVDPNQPTKDQQFRLMAAQLAVNLMVSCPTSERAGFPDTASAILKFLKG